MFCNVAHSLIPLPPRPRTKDAATISVGGRIILSAGRIQWRHHAPGMDLA
ncbi:hypothetical protein AB395_00001897 [Sinorhizobium fredii CCBAU 45436]|nr:hypothetical protein SF83666_c18500 [Sinorhizobium fredii CCBAU 83666]AWI57551.1 hypothetical protein AB395_00001897 [Sinorhizobium fredii CCBAU 45436]